MTHPHNLITRIELQKSVAGEPRCEVKPLVGSRAHNEVFRWQNATDQAITIMFPPNSDPLGIGFTTLEAGEELTRNLSRAARPRTEPYRYAIFCHKTNNFAVMNSDPEIIISD